jgi:hypothetical protein
LIKKITPKLAKVYPFYWKSELVLSKEKSRFELEQESYKELQKFSREFNLSFMMQAKNFS